MSNMKASQKAVNSIIQDMAKEHKPNINVVNISKMDNDGSYVRVTASVTNTAKTEKEPGFIPSAIAETLGSKLRPITKSFHILSSNDIGKIVTGIFTLNPESIAYEDDMEGFKAVSGNMFMDDEEGLWVLRKTEGGKILVKSTGVEDADIIQDLMPAVASSGVGTMAFEANASVERDEAVRGSLQGGDFVTFVNPENETVEFGVTVASVEMDNGDQTNKLVVQSSVENSETQIIDRGMIISKFDDVDVGDMEISESAAAKSLAEIAAYYKQMFIRDPAYYEKFMSRFESHIFA